MSEPISGRKKITRAQRILSPLGIDEVSTSMSIQSQKMNTAKARMAHNQKSPRCETGSGAGSVVNGGEVSHGFGSLNGKGRSPGMLSADGNEEQ